MPLNTLKKYRNNLHGTALLLPEIVTPRDFARRFVCPEESLSYSNALEQMVFRGAWHNSSVIIEFGSGTGSPVISAILNSEFSGLVHGYEINGDAAQMANQSIEEYNLGKNYIVHNKSFFEDIIPEADCLIANPPYLPSEDKALLTLPYLGGGRDGIDVSKQLLGCGYRTVFLEVSSYSDPVALIKHAASLGYKLLKYRIAEMPFGIYSRQEIVQKRIHAMSKEGKAFFIKNHYWVGSALFVKTTGDEKDLSSEFIDSLTSSNGSLLKISRS